MTFSKYFGGGAGPSIAIEARPILASITLPAFTRVGKAQIAAMGGAGGGAIYSSNAAAPSNSSPWGVKVIDIAIGDVLQFVIGAACASASSPPKNGNPGNNTLVKLNGVTIMDAQPGEFGIQGPAPLDQTAPTATVVGADWVVPGIRSGTAIPANTLRGGPAVDVFRCGLGISTGAPGGSVGTNSSGVTPALPIPLTSSELGVTFLGVSLGESAGYGGDPAADKNGGIFAGAAAVAGGASSIPGRGAGSPSGQTVGAPGSAGYAYLIFVPEVA